MPRGCEIAGRGGTIRPHQTPTGSSPRHFAGCLYYLRGVPELLHLLKRHKVPIKAHLAASLVLAYALPEDLLRPLLAPGLELDTYDGFGFLAIAMVQTRELRPAFLAPAFGLNFFLAGYRIFTRYRTPNGRTLRGLRILRSDTDRRSMHSVLDFSTFTPGETGSARFGMLALRLRRQAL